MNDGVVDPEALVRQANAAACLRMDVKRLAVVSAAVDPSALRLNLDVALQLVP